MLPSGFLSILSPIARWLVPKMVKNGVKSSFVYWRLIWACLLGECRRVERCKTWVSIKSVWKWSFSIKREGCAQPRLERQGTQASQKQMCASKLPPNQKIRIMTNLDQFRDNPAR